MKKLCDNILSLVSPYAAGELTGEEKIMVDEHIKECQQCAGKLRNSIRLEEEFSRIRKIGDSEIPWEGYWEGIEEAIRPRRRFFSIRPLFYPALAAAAAVILFVAVSLFQPGPEERTPIFKAGGRSARSFATRRRLPLVFPERGMEAEKKYCRVIDARTGDPSSDIMIYQDDEEKLTIIWLIES